MTTPEPIIPRITARPLPVPLDGDLAIDFRNRNPADPTAFLDYASGVTGVLTIYTDKKTVGATRIVITATPVSYHCVIKIDRTVLNAVEARTLWNFRLVFPDADLPGGYDKVVANGQIERNDGAS